ncbi:MAG: SDR family oxidoreductase [Muribaculaceae bacterium]|nr:SDR family oxidoreductase [Muribaculaceae bacterium]
MEEAKQNKTILVTGASTGIGAAAARRFAAAGWNVILADINREAGEALAAELGDCALFVLADTRDRSAVEAAVAAGIACFGRLDSVFANAGIHRRNRLLDISDEEFDLVVKTNIYGTVNTLRAAVPAIIRSGGGTVVINSSDQAFIGKPGNFAYGLTKGALAQITRTLALELGPEKIRVNAVCPGTVRTPLVDSLFERVSAAGDTTPDELWAEENALFARGRAGEPSEIAELVYFLASDVSSFCTGGLYLADGGLVAG